MHAALIATMVAVLLSAASMEKFVPKTSISIAGVKFCINGRPTYESLASRAHGRLMNVRMVNSVFEDENPATKSKGFDPEPNTAKFIAVMAQYKAAGILAFTINLQGGFPGYEGAVNSAFLPDARLKPEYMKRVARVIEAADARGMVVILGFFYQRQDQVLADENAVRAAAANAAAWVRDRGYGNVLIEIANEYRHPGFDHKIIREEDGEAELMRIVRSRAPGLLVSTSGMGDARFPHRLAEEADFILLHGNTSNPEQYAERVGALKRYAKPIIFNEDWCFSDDTRAIADAALKATAAFEAGASWGIMNQKRNQQWPFVFGIGDPNEGGNAREDFLAYETIARLLGIR